MKVQNILLVLSLIACANISESSMMFARQLIARINAGDPCRCADRFVWELRKTEAYKMREILMATDNSHLLK